MKRFFPIILAAGILLLAQAVSATQILVSAAASLSDALTKIGANFQAQTGIQVEFNFGASSTLARQIEEGAPADIFFSADETQMDLLEKKGLIVPSTRVSRLANSLVVVVPRDSALQISFPGDLTRADVKQIALADPKAVPAGVYAKEWLEKLHLWQAIEPKVVPTENVRGALAAVASGNVDAGVVYKTDAAISKEVKIAYEVPRADGPNISYPMALVKGSPQPDAAKKFLAFLSSEEAGQLFAHYGFLLRQ
ncbi:MAG TPA: molybdate ABC transporter substrate-binding protein [Verrucomicrobiae bacterium]|nr:molybdate ABC transporter substrate-binding protein [Verrucomicrobiae bacterium]